MKKIKVFATLLLSISINYGQTIQVTSFGDLDIKPYVKPGMFPGFHRYDGETIHAYGNTFDSNGNLTGKEKFSVNINDLALKHGYIELDKVWGTQLSSAVKYTNYETGETKTVDLFKLTNTPKGGYVSIANQHTIRDQFVAYNEKSFFVINEDLEVVQEVEAKTKYITFQMFEVFSDGCLYNVYVEKNTVYLKKVDFVNKVESELKFTGSNGLELVPPSLFFASFLDPAEYKLILSPDGSKAFFGFFPGKSIYDNNRFTYVNDATKGRFIIIDNNKFTVEIDKTFDISDDYIQESLGNGKSITTPVVEDVEFLGDELLISTSCMSNWGVNPIAVYRFNLAQGKIEQDGIITNKFDDAITRERQPSQMFSVGNKVYLVYMTSMSDDKAYKTINKTYPTLHIVDLTKGSYDQKIYKDEVAVLGKSKISAYNAIQINSNTILFLASTIGISSYENLFSVKLIFE